MITFKQSPDTASIFMKQEQLPGNLHPSSPKIDARNYLKHDHFHSTTSKHKVILLHETLAATRILYIFMRHLICVHDAPTWSYKSVPLEHVGRAGGHSRGGCDGKGDARAQRWGLPLCNIFPWLCRTGRGGTARVEGEANPSQPHIHFTPLNAAYWWPCPLCHALNACTFTLSMDRSNAQRLI